MSSGWKKQLSNRSRNEALKFLIDFSGVTLGRGAQFNYSQYKLVIFPEGCTFK